jgi:hypothetical protein
MSAFDLEESSQDTYCRSGQDRRRAGLGMLVKRKKIGSYVGSETTVVQRASGHANDLRYIPTDGEVQKLGNLNHISLQNMRIEGLLNKAQDYQPLNSVVRVQVS